MNTKKDEIVHLLSQAIMLKNEVEAYVTQLQKWLRSDITPQDWQIAPPTMTSIKQK